MYGADDGKIGSVQRVMIDKISGKVAYAVVSFGGFLGMGEDYYPLPWPNLKYDTRLGGYRVGITCRTTRLKLTRHALKEEWDGHLQNMGYVLQPARAHSIVALFIFLNLLKREANPIRKIRLAHAEHQPSHSHAAPHMLVNWIGKLLRH